MKRRSNHSHSSLNQSWVLTPDEGSDNEEGYSTPPIIHSDQNYRQYVNAISGDPFECGGLETVSKENIEIIDTIDSDDDDDVGVVFGGNSTRGWKIKNT